jgi:hypothetical protein
MLEVLAATAERLLARADAGAEAAPDADQSYV